MSEVEQRSQLNEHLPSVESYQRRRMGTSAVTVCLAIHEYVPSPAPPSKPILIRMVSRYTLDIRLPQHVFDSPLMQSLWDATNVIISVLVVAKLYMIPCILCG